MASGIWGETEKMAVLHLQKTGHVLGAVTVLGATDAAPAVESVAGDAMPVEGGPTVPRAYLATTLVAFKQEALVRPTSYVLADESLEVPPSSSMSVALDASKITITPGALITRDLAYFIRIEDLDHDPSFERAGTAKPANPPVGTIEVQFDSPLVSGTDYLVLVAVAGHPLSVATKTAP